MQCKLVNCGVWCCRKMVRTKAEIKMKMYIAIQVKCLSLLTVRKCYRNSWRHYFPLKLWGPHQTTQQHIPEELDSHFISSLRREHRMSNLWDVIFATWFMRVDQVSFVLILNHPRYQTVSTNWVESSKSATGRGFLIRLAVLRNNTKTLAMNFPVSWPFHEFIEPAGIWRAVAWLWRRRHPRELPMR